MGTLNCTTGSGAIIYPYNGAPGPGLSGGGNLWSSAGGIMWINWNNAPAYPVYLKPGWNDVHYYIPLIFPDDEWVEAPVIIIAPGYILIPAGFELNLGVASDAPIEAPNPSRVDSIQFKDIYDVELVEVPVPIDTDAIIEEIGIEDINAIDIINAVLLTEELLVDEINIQDVNEITLVNTTLLNDSEEVEELSFTDINNDTSITTAVVPKDESMDNVGFTDILDIDTN